ncbi:phosphoglycerate dehydrogenase [Microbaculum marinum]|uniref:Phosphoglycerate dehydrogenase n=1 Tax=Microbaculum marinum TaxID=1764581 RepID=A0AAW9RKX1_9HYPH
MTTVAVCSRSFSAHPVLRAELLARYPNSRFNDLGRSLAGDDLIAFLADADKAIIALERLNAEVISRLPKLKVVGKYGVGLDGLDLRALAEAGIGLGWTPGVNRRSVAELVLSLAISLLRHVPNAAQEVKYHQWRQHTGRQLSGRTVGIVGCGHVGKDLVRLLQPFGCRILANDIIHDEAFNREFGVEAAPLADLLGAADVVTLHLPLDRSTRLLFSRDRLGSMKPGSILINTARGGIVDEEALIDVLRDGPVAAAAFDVFAEEPVHDDRLLSLANFIATPHIGGSSEEAILAMGRAAIAGLDDYTVATAFLHDDCGG